MSKIGVLGGTFDPVHLGHLIIAEEVWDQLGLDLVLFVPARQSPLKAGKRPASEAHRLAMLRLATAGNPHFAISTVDLDREPPSYTVDTLQLLRGQGMESCDLHFIVGLDALRDLLRWREPARLASLCHIVGVTRPGDMSLDLAVLAPVIPDVEASVRILAVPEIGISASQVRQRVREGKSIRYLVPDEVVQYIQEQQLYKSCS